MGTLIMVVLALYDPNSFVEACVIVVPTLTIIFAFWYAPFQILTSSLLVSASLLMLNTPGMWDGIDFHTKVVFWGKATEVISYLLLTVVTFANFIFGRKPDDSLRNMLSIFFRKKKGNSGETV